MRILTTAVLISAVSLSACGAIGETDVNPINWFGKGRVSKAVSEQSEPTNPLIAEAKGGLFKMKRDRGAIYLGTPIDQVTNLVIERVPGGAIIRATGLTAVQGVFQVQLTPTTEDEKPVNGVLTYRLEGIRPPSARAVGSMLTRTVVAARALTDQELSDVRTIRVEATRNAQTSRPR